MDESLSRREAMVNGQIRPNKVVDERITAALLAVPREPFLPGPLRGVAYLDEDIAVGEGRYLMEPVAFARLLQAAEIGADDVVLDIGCASGYSSAVIARLASAVVALEAAPELGARANEILAELEIDNIAVVEGPLEAGYAEQGPYDVIFIGGAIERLPEALPEQLAEGGRLVVVERRGGIGRAMRYGKHDGLVSGLELFDAQVALLPGFEARPAFVF
ncbi:MAG: protein-L-isoaspartate O-methyltransferase [Alphaproteobacteria bacterium]|jgi:protein-L-isoaspartate(D-aspartate) O-methyltransferase|nr:protein-L-isoaspartate O-methyltransferase [Alphaproteobacteria bacterium]